MFTMKNLFITTVSFMMTLAVAASGQDASAPAKLADVSSPAPAVSASSAPTLQQRNPRYQLRRGDSFDVEMAFSPEFNQTVEVQPDGYVTLKQVGSVFVEGQTIPELTGTLQVAYSKILHDPVITIGLKDFEMPYFIASGQVGKPGKYDLRSDLTVTEAVAIAGGFSDKSKHSQVVLFRPAPGGGGFDAKLINVKKLLASHDLSEDIHLQPGDMLYVPQNAMSKIRPFLPTPSMGAYYNPAVF
jgi:polysaccharide export outer membrane protein